MSANTRVFCLCPPPIETAVPNSWWVAMIGPRTIREWCGNVNVAALSLTEIAKALATSMSGLRAAFNDMYLIDFEGGPWCRKASTTPLEPLVVGDHLLYNAEGYDKCSLLLGNHILTKTPAFTSPQGYDDLIIRLGVASKSLPIEGNKLLISGSGWGWTVYV